MTFREFTLCVNLSNFIFSLFKQVVVKGYTHILIYRGKKTFGPQRAFSHNKADRLLKCLPVLFPQGVLRPVKNNKLVIALCFPNDRSSGVLMDIVYLTTWVRYSILQIISVARENGFTSKQLIFFSPLRGASLNSR